MCCAAEAPRLESSSAATLTPGLVAELQARYELGPIVQSQALAGGEWKTLFRLDRPHGAIVVSISHPSADPAGIAYEHAFLRYLSARLPQAAAPIAARDGGSYFRHGGRFVALFPYMPGRMADRSIRAPAGRLLAEFQRVALAYPDRSARPGQPALREWSWERNHAWDWPVVQELLATHPDSAAGAARRFWQAGGAWAARIVARRDQIAQAHAQTQSWVAQLARSKRHLSFGSVHDDFYKNNMLVDGEQITALLDWDGCHPDWLLLDVSNAIWEFCHEKNTHRLDTGQARAFLDAYSAADGPVAIDEFDLILPFIRLRRILEILSALQGIVNGDAWDSGHAEYMLHNLIALEYLMDPVLQIY
jgi:Ser/Thr protein kinase RdoA (MazF antagonist)